MGRKGRQRKAKRAPAVSTPVPRRLAAETGNSASSVSSCGVQGGSEQSARLPPTEPSKQQEAQQVQRSFEKRVCVVEEEGMAGTFRRGLNFEVE